VASIKKYYVTTNQAIAATAHLGNEALRTARDLHQAAALAEVWHDDMNRLAQSLDLLLEGNLHDIDQRRQQLRDQIIMTLFDISLLDKLQQFPQDIQQSASVSTRAGARAYVPAQIGKLREVERILAHCGREGVQVLYHLPADLLDALP
jgi:hypothetical protein